MYRTYILLLLVATLPALGLSLKNARDCSGRECVVKFRNASLKVLKVEWEALSVWPEEAKRFKNN